MQSRRLISVPLATVCAWQVNVARAPCADLINPGNPHRDCMYVCPFDGNFCPGKRYSLILVLDVLEHMDDPIEALRRALDLDLCRKVL